MAKKAIPSIEALIAKYRVASGKRFRLSDFDPGVPFQQKPFHPDALVKQVRDLLDARKPPRGS